MGDANRLGIIRLLLKKDHCVNEIAEQLGVTSYNVSKHLGVLRSAGLVTIVTQGQKRIYSLAPKWVAESASAGRSLDLGCCTFDFSKPWRYSTNSAGDAPESDHEVQNTSLRPVDLPQNGSHRLPRKRLDLGRLLATLKVTGPRPGILSGAEERPPTSPQPFGSERLQQRDRPL